MQQNHGVHEFRIVVNLAPDMKAARDVFSRLYKACDHFLAGVALDFAGMIPRDAQVRKAVLDQKPFCIQDPGGPAGRAVAALAKTIQTWDVPETLDGNIKFFWKRLLFRV